MSAASPTHSWKRTYWAVWLSNLVTSIGMMSFLPFFPSHLAGLGLEDPDEIAAWTGLIFGAAPLMAAVMGPVWGSVGDRFGRRLMILRALFAISIFVGAMAFARTPLELFLLRALQGVFSGFVAPSITLVGVVAPADVQGRVTGSLQTALAAGTIVGPLVGAALVTAMGLEALFLCVSGAVLTSALVVLFLVPADRIVRREPTGPVVGGIRALRAELRGHLASPALRATLALVFGVQFAIGATAPQMELFVGELWTGEVARISQITALLFSLAAAADLVGMPIWGHRGDRSGHRRMILVSAVGTGAALLAHSVVPGVLALAAARLALGATSAGVKPCAFGLLAEETAFERRGSAVGLMLSARQLAVSSAAMIGGLASAALGLRGLFALGGAGLLLLVGWYVRRRALVPVDLETDAAERGRPPAA